MGRGRKLEKISQFPRKKRGAVPFPRAAPLRPGVPKRKSGEKYASLVKNRPTLRHSRLPAFDADPAARLGDVLECRTRLADGAVHARRRRLHVRLRSAARV